MIAVISGSKNDKTVVEPALIELKDLPVEITYYVASAHRSPEKLARLIQMLEQKDTRVIIAVAGHAAHLAGVIAAQTLTPVYGVPLATSELKGVDALYSMVMMPGGIPVATFGHGKSGIQNAVLMACAHLAKDDPKMKKALEDYRKKLADAIPGSDPVWSNK